MPKPKLITKYPAPAVARGLMREFPGACVAALVVIAWVIFFALLGAFWQE